METKKLYFSSCNYNMIRLQDAVIAAAAAAGAKIVKNDYKKDTITFYNRSFLEKINKNNDIIAALERHGKSADHLKTENAALQADFENSAYTTKESFYTFGGVSFKFVLNNFLYDFSQESNPFFPAYIRKIKVDENGSYTGDYCSDTIEGTIPGFENIFCLNLTDDDIKAAAGDLFNYIIENAKNSAEYIEKQKRRVSNTYNSGYHYETITKRNNKKTVLQFVE